MNYENRTDERKETQGKKMKEENKLKGLCISINVSKGESHVGSFVDPMSVYRKVFVIKHDLKGFQKIKALHDEMKEKYREEICIVFEATGVYHLLAAAGSVRISENDY